MSEKVLKGFGQLFFKTPEKISAEPGSNYLLSIFDTQSKIGGLCRLDAAASLSANENQVKGLLREFKSAGCSPVNLELKLVGGFGRDEGSNRKFTADLRSQLSSFGLELSKVALGGTGKKISFETGTGFFHQASHVHAAVEREPAKRSGPIRVLIVDDARTIRSLFSSVFQKDPRFEVVGLAANPDEAEEILKHHPVDVMTLDIQMPVMDGISYLKKIMLEKPMPVLMVSGLSNQDGGLALTAVESGAIDFIEKPEASQLKNFGELLAEKVIAAAGVDLAKLKKKPQSSAKKYRCEVDGSFIDSDLLVCIGASTGGTVALTEVLTALPSQIPPIVIVQHIPAEFSRLFANRLNDLCSFEVKEAKDGDTVQPNRVLIAPGGLQMYVDREKKASLGSLGLCVRVKNDPPVNRHQPSVDALFDSICRLNLPRVIAGILTGMGRDGAEALLRLKNNGAETFGQDQASSVVYGMPKAAAELGAVESVLALDQIAPTLSTWMMQKARKKRAS